MSDNISRKSALDALKAIRYGLWEIDIPSPVGCPEYVEHHEQIQHMMGVVDGWIKKISEEEPASDWIPCSERLPEADVCPMDCMVTRESQYIGNYVDMAVCESNGTWTHEDWDAIVVGDVESGRKTGLISTRDDKIIAWMPLPEPYKGGADMRGEEE